MAEIPFYTAGVGLVDDVVGRQGLEAPQAWFESHDIGSMVG